MTPTARVIADVEATTRDLAADMDALGTLISRMRHHETDVAELANRIEKHDFLASDSVIEMAAVATRRYRAAREGLGEAKFNLAIAAAKVKEINGIIRT